MRLDKTVQVQMKTRSQEESVKSTSYNAHFFQNATNFKIESSLFYSARGDIHVGNTYIDPLLTRIPYADGAGIDTRKACLEGTRIDGIRGWVTTADAIAPQVLWLSGPAGTGKSALDGGWKKMGALGRASVLTDKLPLRLSQL